MVELTFVQFMVAFFMGLSAVSVFLWAVLSGMFINVEDVKYRAYRAEVRDDDPRDTTTS